MILPVCPLLRLISEVYLYRELICIDQALQLEHGLVGSKYRKDRERHVHSFLLVAVHCPSIRFCCFWRRIRSHASFRSCCTVTNCTETESIFGFEGTRVRPSAHGCLRQQDNQTVNVIAEVFRSILTSPRTLRKLLYTLGSSSLIFCTPRPHS